MQHLREHDGDVVYTISFAYHAVVIYIPLGDN